MLTSKGTEYVASLNEGQYSPTLVDGSPVPKTKKVKEKETKKVKGIGLFLVHQIIYAVGWKHGQFWVGNGTMARRCGVDEKTIRNWYGIFESLGIIERVKIVPVEGREHDSKSVYGTIRYRFMLHMPQGTLIRGSWAKEREAWERHYLERELENTSDKQKAADNGKKFLGACRKNPPNRMSENASNKHPLTINNKQTASSLQANKCQRIKELETTADMVANMGDYPQPIQNFINQGIKHGFIPSVNPDSLKDDEPI